MNKTYDFCGWATKSNVLCSDGLTIASDAFKDCDGTKVPLVWNHRHNDPTNILGHAMLECRNGGVYAYCSFNDTENGQTMKKAVQHGDIASLSICANELKKQSRIVKHGKIKEVSLVIAPANPKAMIDQVVYHADGTESILEDEGIIYTGEPIELYHADEEDDDETVNDIYESLTDTQKAMFEYLAGIAQGDEDELGDEAFMRQNEEAFEKENGTSLMKVYASLNEKQKDVLMYVISQAKEGDKKDDKKDDEVKHGDKTVMDVINTMNEEQKVVLYALLDDALSEGQGEDDDEEDDDEEDDDEEDDEEEKSTMKHNVFDNETVQENVLTHSDQETILTMAKSSNYGTLKSAMTAYMDSNENLQHGFEADTIDTLFPEYANVRPGAPEYLAPSIYNDWISKVMSGVHKSPISRIRSRFAYGGSSFSAGNFNPANPTTFLRALGYKKGDKKEGIGTLKLINRTTDPQTVYVKDTMNRDDKLDITDFDVVAYIQQIMRQTLNEELARAILFGDGREEGDAQKIAEDKIRPIYKDDELYTIHAQLDREATKAIVEGTVEGGSTSVPFDEKYIMSESIVEAVMNARTHYRGSGSLDLFCTPKMLNSMLLARDRNGRRMYDSINDLRAALNVQSIITVEQMESVQRVDDGTTYDLCGILVDLRDYYVGATKGGEITSFSDFDIDFNQEKYLIETRLSGALVRPKSAIALEVENSVGRV